MDKPAATLDDIFEPIRLDLEQVEREFAREVESQVPVIPEIGRYLQGSGGKRIRPAVLLMASRLAGYTGDLAILYASIVEFIHTATLTHDDIVDDSATRRGRPAVHARWGNDVAVLVGDYLYIKAMALALTRESLDVLHLLCEATLRMIEGELLQLSKNGDLDITEEEHFGIIERKTACLFGGCAEIGGVLARTAPERQRALRDYGFNLGIAFQLVDDVLDLTGREDVLGKPIAGDLREGKLTLPVIHMLREGEQEARQAVLEVVRQRRLTPERWRDIANGLGDCRSIDYASRRAREFAVRAQSSLDVFPAGPERDALMALPDYVLSRDR